MQHRVHRGATFNISGQCPGRAGIAADGMRLSQNEDVLRLIDAVCESFTACAGTPLRFHRAPVTAQCRLAHGTWKTTISVDKRTLGVLELGQTSADAAAGLPIDLQTRRLAQHFAGLLRQNLRVNRELTARTTDFATLLDAIGATRSEMDPQQAFARLIDAAIALAGFHSAAFFLLNADMMTLQLRLFRGRHTRGELPLQRELQLSPPDMTALRGESAVVRRRGSMHAARWLPPSAATGCCIGIASGAGPIGTLWLFDRRDRSIDAGELRILEPIAVNIANVFERLLLARESRNQQRLQTELRLASREMRFRDEHESFASGRLEVAVHRGTLSELGGDLIELIPVDEHRTVLAIGDATGHGVPAAVVISAVRGCIRGVVVNNFADVENPDLVLQQVNAAFCGMANHGFYATLFLAVIDTRAMTVRFANAGHPRPLFFQEMESSRLDAAGLLLGFTSDIEYTASQVAVKPGDVFVGFSDGIVEAGASRNMFQTEGIEASVTQENRRSATDLMNAILRRVDEHSGGCAEDDQSLVVVRFGSRDERPPADVHALSLPAAT